MFTQQHINVNGVDNIKIRANIIEVDRRKETLKYSSHKGCQTLHRGY